LLFFVVWAITISVMQLSSEVALVLGAVMGVTLGLLLCKSKWEDYAQRLFDGLAQPIGVIAMVAWFYAGMFAQILQVGGLVEGLVWIGSVTGVEGGLFVALTFLLASVFSTAVGTGYGTTVAFCTLMYPAGVAVGEIRHSCSPPFWRAQYSVTTLRRFLIRRSFQRRPRKRMCRASSAAVSNIRLLQLFLPSSFSRYSAVAARRRTRHLQDP